MTMFQLTALTFSTVLAGQAQADSLSSQKFSNSKSEIRIEAQESGYSVETTETLANGRIHRSRLGEGFRCSEGTYGNGSNPALKTLNCEKQLTEKDFVLVNIVPVSKESSLYHVEVELYNSTLGSSILHILGADFSPSSL